MQDKQLHIVYVLSHIHWFGEIGEQIVRLRNFFYDNNNKYKFTVITYPIDTQLEHVNRFKVNKALYNIVMQGINVIHTKDASIIWPQHLQNSPLIMKDDIIYVICDNTDLYKKFSLKYQHRNLDFYLSLGDGEHVIGSQIRDDFGIPETAPVVTLHVREISCDKNVRNTFRNVNIENYIPAVNYLIDQGFYVVRIGEKGMKKIINAPKQFIDAPFHPAYTDMVDPYFLAASKFLLGTESGPLAIAYSFGTPKLITNACLQSVMYAGARDFYTFKKCFSHQLKRSLTYEEILLSPIIFDYGTQIYQKLNIELIENTPEEILMATKEMLSRLNGTYSSAKEMAKINRHFQTIQSKVRYLENQLEPDISYIPLYHFFDSEKVPISIEYLKANPDFMGHDFSAIFDIYNKKNSDSHNKDNNFSIICPHCNETLSIASKGRWNCPCCKNDFTC